MTSLTKENTHSNFSEPKPASSFGSSLVSPFSQPMNPLAARFASLAAAQKKNNNSDNDDKK